MRRQRQQPPSRNNGSINHQGTGHSLILLPSCSKIGVHFVATVDHPGREFLPGSAGRRPGALWQARDLQHRQGSLFTSRDWTDRLEASGIQISMDAKGRWLDNVFMERLWRSLKQECVYLNAFDSVRDCQAGISPWTEYYNRKRTHSSLGDLTPSEAYET